MGKKGIDSIMGNFSRARGIVGLKRNIRG